MRRKKSALIFLWLLIAALFWWAWRDISLPQVWDAVSRLSLISLGILLALNGAILLLFSSRWWLIIRALGYKIPYFSLAKYRLASFGLSYFTPGPQFGGEPLQIYFLHANHQVPTDTGLASVSLDKLLEMLANFTFLSIGIMLMAWQGFFFQEMTGIVVAFSAGMVILLLGYLLALLIGNMPLTWILGLIPLNKRWQTSSRAIRQTILNAESQIGAFCRQQPRILIQSSFLSALIWLSIFGEYALALRFFGLETSLINILTIIVFARLAFLTPLPGGLGALEAGQVIAMQSLGLDPVFGVSISLFIRVRDTLFGLLGLWIGSTASRPNSHTSNNNSSENKNKPVFGVKNPGKP
ncbi:MAG: flippase-like domain-containing protein [Anaerolineae bacterium]|nr:flippase-like domain-containing protein [Anaerolineae bacterium]